LFKLVRERVRTPEEVFGLMEALERRGEVFAALSNVTHEYWIETPSLRPLVREVQLFRVRQMTPLLFAAWERFSREDFARVLKLTNVLSFRYSVVSGLNTNELEPAYHRAAREVLSGAVTSPRGVFERLRDIAVPDEKFEEDFTRLSVDTGGQRKQLAKYILARLEADASGRPCDPDTDPATIEHILPENPSREWEATFPPDQWPGAVYRVGNLSLLEPNINRDIGNAPFAAKMPRYAASRYELTRSVAGRGHAEWTLDILEARQRDLSRRAVHLWRPDFA
jgi:hypothetical protein